MENIWHLVFDVIALLGGSLILGGIFSRFGQSPLVGYILAGMAIGGPGSLRIVESEKEIEAVAELGISLLLFSLGLEFSVHRLKSLGGRILWAGFWQVVLTTFLAGIMAAVFGLSPKSSLAIGMMVALSSTACVLRVLMERAELDTGQGRNSLGVLLVQDMAVVPLAILMSVMAVGGTPMEITWNLGKIAIFGVILVVSLYLLLAKVAVWALGTLTLERNRELTVLLAVVTGLGSAWAAHSAEISPAMGAFVAGLFLGSSPFATQIRADVSSLKVLLLTLFFGGAGMIADANWILQNWYSVLLVTALLVLVKTGVVWGILRWMGQPHQIAIASGLCLSQIGEFAFVLGSIARVGDLLSEDLLQLVFSTAIVSLFLTPFLIPASSGIGLFVAGLLRKDTSRTLAVDGVEKYRPDVVIVGFGPAGRIAASPFVGGLEKVLVIDLNREGVRKAKEMGFVGQIGDATQAEILEHAHAESAKLVLITIPHYPSARAILHQLRTLAPHAQYVVRSRHQIHSEDLASAGATAVFGDEEEIGSKLALFAQNCLEELSERENRSNRRVLTSHDGISDHLDL